MLRPLAALLLMAAALAPAADADWASFHADARGTGYIPNSSYPVYQDVWWNNRTLANAQVQSSPVIKDGILVTADLGSATSTPANGGLVRALDVESGHQIWSYRMPAPIYGTPAIAGERVYVVDSQGNLKAFNLRDGRVEDSAASAVGATRSSIREHEGKLFIGTEAGEMKAYLASSLTLLWTYTMSTTYTVFVSGGTTGPGACQTPLAPGAIRGAAAVVDGKVIFGSFNHYVIAVDENGNGQTTAAQWFYKVGDIVVGAPSVILGNPNHVVVGSYDGSVYNFVTSGPTPTTCPSGTGSVPATNNPTWKYQVPSVVDATTGETQVSKVASSPANSGSRVFVGANNGHVYGLNAATGAKVWEQSATGTSIKPVTGSPAVANGIVVIGSEDTKMYWLSAANGSILKTFQTKASISSSPAIDGDRVIVSATDGTTYMFGPKVPPRADLTATVASATALSVVVLVKNIGTEPAAAGMVRIFLDEGFLVDLPVGALAAGQSQTVTHTPAATIAPGKHIVKASADWTNTMQEANEGNNDSPPLEIQATVPETTSTTKKGPAAGIMFAGLLLVCAAMGRRWAT
ncbi:MAG TPA: PQQ-binding-like beta-propeller repeat protein [Candidatus Thermoplasmatota archaeon]|nr:PQQ-binding-like beta-propeller repeat protein [Candidatus Thermoplasmatota archaeon]